MKSPQAAPGFTKSIDVGVTCVADPAGMIAPGVGPSLAPPAVEPVGAAVEVLVGPLAPVDPDAPADEHAEAIIDTVRRQRMTSVGPRRRDAGRSIVP